MSKYVRTENRIYPVCQAEDRWKELGYRVVGSKIILIPYDDIIKEADTIEELVDEYVVIRDNTKINQLVRTDDIKYLKKLIKEDKRIIEIKGAIWTDKGLIYVAKMNDKGELELI